MKRHDALAEFGDAHHPLVARTLCEHVAIRQQAQALALAPEAGARGLRDLGAQLAHHIRGEERELFPLIEDTLPDAELHALARLLERDDAGSYGR